jgi:two-component sensor histidine kinase
MTITRLLNFIAAIGLREDYKPWEINLVRKLNLCSLFGTLNVIIALIIFPLAGYSDSVPECLVVLALAPCVLVLNARVGYVAAAYLFSFIGCFLFFCLSIKLGIESFSFLYYFPLLIGITNMLARKELFIHLLMNLIMCVISVIGILIVGHFFPYTVFVSPNTVALLRYINIGFSFFVCIGFIIIVSLEAIKQEKQLKLALHQKEILLAELFHRVKNNLSIVTSLLNLKKNATTSVEAQHVLEDCRNLIFSMALVHTKMYNSNTADTLNFKEYLSELLPELINSIGGDQHAEFSLTATDLRLGLLQAVPCGLIINELVTNAFKHATVPGKKLQIHLKLKTEGNAVFVEVKDNGPGKPEKDQPHDSLGMDLIKSLTEQLDGVYSFKNNDGLQFNLQFAQV